MAAPMTELLFLFLLGIASWSGCVAENTVTLIESSCAPVDGNEVIDSLNCEISDNKLQAKLYVKKNCPGVVQVKVETLKDGAVVNSGGQSYKQLPKEIQDLNICESIEGQDPDGDDCSASDGEIVALNCDVQQWFKDMDNGKFDVNAEFSIDGDILGSVYFQVDVEPE